MGLKLQKDIAHCVYFKAFSIEQACSSFQLSHIASESLAVDVSDSSLLVSLIWHAEPGTLTIVISAEL